MDPDKTLKEILDPKNDPFWVEQACASLYDWLRRGGFRPKEPEGMKYWPGTGTRYSIGPYYVGGRDLWCLTRWGTDGSFLEQIRIF